MLERNRIIQQAANLGCLSPEPGYAYAKDGVNKSPSATNVGEVFSYENGTLPTTVNGQSKNGTKYPESEKQSNSSASAVSSPSSNSREEEK